MKSTSKNILLENQRALAPMLVAGQSWGNKKSLCWKCQQEKPRKGGFQRIMPGLVKFICKDCMDAKREAA